ncbi:flagellar filament capping protein FliD [Chitiniphilus purpureus]|uniref:Flagellar hook-associated protein 2 n=1 Tax=Chitiniphilus purpureus TaxID=2981137 RepID=A0ABY6DHB0_9NEIS|nr:flagellar filament capping protein FliD [Chitiniphilus sp. CD1]UXY13707.1 flagellar filament capping protein FliD [Chitiniphilus sp. CD1]
MATLTSAGLGSGLPVNSIISQLMDIERQPLTKLQTKSTEAQAKISAIGSLQSALSSFQARVLSLSSASAYKSVQGSLGDSAIGTVSTAVTAQAGSYTLAVKQLAQSQKLKSDVFTSVNSPVGTGKLTIQFGTYKSGDNSFTVNGDKGAFTVDVNSTNNTLTGLRDAINAKKAGVTATIVNDGSGYRLLLSSTDSGSANSLRVQVEDDDGNATDTSGLSRFAYDPTATKNLSQTQAAQDAKFTLDGIEITKPTNTVSDVLQGVTLTLQKISTLDSGGNPVSTSLNVSRDTSGVKKSVQDFVDAYNEFAKAADSLSFYNQEDKSSGVLNGDYVIRTMQSTIRGTLNQALGGGSHFQSLGAVGISFDAKGKMTLDAGKLQTALNERPDDVASLFAVNGVASDARVSYISSSAATSTGSFAINVTQPATRGALSGLAVAGSAFDIVADQNDMLMVAVDGASSGQVKLTPGNYASPAALAAEIQSKVNGDPSLKKAGASVTVTYNADTMKFEMTSNKYGSASSVQITSTGPTAETTYGFRVAQMGTGKDVEGTINGETAKGSGQTLTGAGAAEGLQLNVTGDTAGSYGTVAFSRGFASKLDTTLNSLMSDKGLLKSRLNALNQDIKNIASQSTSLNRRLEDIEKRYRAQFTALDVQIATMNSTSSYLGQQLSMLNNLASNNK